MSSNLLVNTGEPSWKRSPVSAGSDDDEGGQNKRFNRRYLTAMLVLSAVLFSTQCVLLPQRMFDPDEFEHLHAGWLVHQSQIPYVDFFEHHTPWLYYLVAPWFGAFEVETNAESAIAFLRLARVGALVATGFALAAMLWTGKAVGGNRMGVAAALLVASNPLFLRKTLEFRPDVPALLLWVVCLGLLFRAFSGLSQSGKARLLFFGAGLCLGAATMFTQKMLFVLPGLGSALLLWLACGGAREDWISRLTRCGLMALGTAIPGLLTWLAFAVAGAGTEFIEKNFLLNAAWKVRVSPLPNLVGFFSGGWPLVFLASGGCIACWSERPGKGNLSWPGVVLCLAAGGLLAGLWIIPVAQGQYYLMLIPLLALLGAAYFERQIASISSWRLKRVVFFAAVIGLCIIPLIDFRTQLKYANRKQLDSLRFVMANSEPTDPVMDGWRGLGVFRPHAFFYYFLHPEIRAMVPPKELSRFLTDLETGTVRPKLIVMDSNLQQLSPRFARFVQNNYVLDKERFIYVRKDSR